ncbi:AAA family ATPase [Blautia hydrogenotrophica]|nr:MoxR family ATPase [Blautia hydrogenotrophica]MCT6797585.1 MoxR family ATPase [Blautia hydrogenotrophica]MEE0462707.1 MoxR family ATPase [Blautia hydrogenotrophica]
MSMLDFLKQEMIDSEILSGIEEFRRRYPIKTTTLSRCPRYLYYGKAIWEQAAAALLCGENILLTGSKATGKNVLAENLAAVFGRPSWNVSLHINMDASYMIGTDTFQDGQVTFRPGPVYQCAQEGGFCVLDEINMARNEALAVLHSILDFRRVIHVPGYGELPLHDASRFIATMNYGYAGTRELNEALSSRFVVIQMPEISNENLEKLITREFPSMKKEYVKQFCGLFQDISQKCLGGEITSRVLDLRGLLDAIRLIQTGLSPYSALDMGISNKTFDSYEQTLIKDIIASRISPKISRKAVFSE